MSLMCQQNSYLTEFHTLVKSCSPASVIVLENGKKDEVQGYEVILEDTILFPEGGGQPEDRGTINDIPVLRVTRVAADAVHFVTSEIAKDTEVKVIVDWSRRFDHMQQHTAQHLITAIIHQKFGYKTTSWSLGTEIVFIELDTPVITGDQILEIDRAVNQSIRNNATVTPICYSDKDDPELKQARGLGLPADHVGPVRVLKIDSIDQTLCCGTHVSNLCHIQAIKILGAEKGKKNKMNLTFLAGGRLLHYVESSFKREKLLTGILKGSADQHCDLADKAVKGFKAMQKACNLQLRELATLEVAIFKQSSQKDILFVKHRKEGSNDYISVLIKELGDETLPKMITVGDEKEDGIFVLAGSDGLLKDMGSKICDILEGKGASNNGVFRGKAAKLSNRDKAEKLLREYLNSRPLGDSLKEG